MFSWFHCDREFQAGRPLFAGAIGAAAILVLACVMLAAGGYGGAEALPARAIAGVNMGSVDMGSADMGPDVILVRQRGGRRMRMMKMKKKRAAMHRHWKQKAKDHADNHQAHQGHNNQEDHGTPDNPPPTNDGKPTNTGKPTGGPWPGRDGRPSINIVCIAGRVLGGRCHCGPREGRHDLGGRVFSCANPSPRGRPSEPMTLAGSGGNSPPPAPRNPQLPPAAAQQPPPNTSGLPQFVPDEIVVRIARATPEAVDDAIGQTHGLQLLERSTIDLLGVRLVRYRVPNNRPLTAALTALQGDPRVLGPQLNYYYRHLQGGADPSNGLQYALVKLDVVRAQTVARGGGTRIAVIDLGIDQTHPDLNGSVVETFSGAAGAGNDPHGTEISGIISAHGIVRGVAPEAKLLDVRVFTGGSGRQASATTFNLVRGIDWALSRRARVLNMSFTGPSDLLLEESIKAAGAKGAIVVAAAGNGGPKAAPAYPAAYQGVIAVTATDVADRLYSHANRGRYISVAAPGVDVLAPSGNHAHQMLSGTSYAAAHVSGIVALMVERYPALDADAARLALTASAIDLGPPGPDDQFGAGRVNAFATLRAVTGH